MDFLDWNITNNILNYVVQNFYEVLQPLLFIRRQRPHQFMEFSGWAQSPKKETSIINFPCPLSCILFPHVVSETNTMVLATSHIAKQIQHSKLANRQLESQKQRKISRPLTSGPEACQRHRAGEPGDASEPRASSFPASRIGCAGLRHATRAWARVPLQGNRPELGLLRRRGSSGAARSSRTEQRGARESLRLRVWCGLLAYMGQVLTQSDVSIFEHLII